MKYLSVYSGIGMHDLGFERAGWQCVGQVEIDPYCRAVLEKHWPNVPRWNDVRSVTVVDVLARCGRIDLLTGGFACQDISVAGAGSGITRISRSGITFRNLFRLARGLRPTWLVLENVAALRTRGYDRIAAVLERIGYAVWPLMVAASDVGAPHLRRRVWIVGRRDDGAAIDAVADADCLREPQPRRGESAIGGRFGDSGGEDLADSRQSRLAGRRGLSFSTGEEIAVPSSSGGYRWPAGPSEPQHEWEAPRLVESSLGGAASRDARRLDGFARRNALKAFGNGNPPQVAELIARTINAAVAALRLAGVA